MFSSILAAKLFLKFYTSMTVINSMPLILIIFKAMKNVERYPLGNSFAFHTLGTNDKNEVSHCAQEFLNYIRSLGPIVDKSVSRRVNQKIHSYAQSEKSSQKYLRQIIQALNLSLTPEQTNQIFPSLLEQKFRREEDDEIEEKTGKELFEELYKQINES